MSRRLGPSDWVSGWKLWPLKHPSGGGYNTWIHVNTKIWTRALGASHEGCRGARSRGRPLHLETDRSVRAARAPPWAITRTTLAFFRSRDAVFRMFSASCGLLRLATSPISDRSCATSGFAAQPRVVLPPSAAACAVGKRSVAGLRAHCCTWPLSHTRRGRPPGTCLSRTAPWRPTADPLPKYTRNSEAWRRGPVRCGRSRQGASANRR